jgi:hypothetical protein
MIKSMAFIAGLCAITLLAYTFMGEQTKSQLGQAGRSLIEQGKELTEKVKDDISTAGTTPKESLPAAPENSVKAETAPAETALAEKEPVETSAEADDEARPKAADRTKDSDEADPLADAQSILMNVGRN